MATKLMTRIPGLNVSQKARLACILLAIKRRRALLELLSDIGQRRGMVMKMAHLLESQGIPYGVAQKVAWIKINKFMEA